MKRLIYVYIFNFLFSLLFAYAFSLIIKMYVLNCPKYSYHFNHSDLVYRVRIDLRWLDWVFERRYRLALRNLCTTTNDPTENRLPQLYQRKIKVSDEVSFMEIGVAKATLWRHFRFYIIPNYLSSRDNFGKRSLDLRPDVLVLRSTKFYKFLWKRFRVNFEWSFKVLKYNKNKTILKCY